VTRCELLHLGKKGRRGGGEKENIVSFSLVFLLDQAHNIISHQFPCHCSRWQIKRETNIFTPPLHVGEEQHKKIDISVEVCKLLLTSFNVLPTSD
jgi:hypothetical protein